MKLLGVPVTKIAHGEKITRDGIYDMPMSWYHDDCCDGPSISSSGLRTIHLFSPRHYWITSPLNPGRLDDDDSAEKKHFRMGRAAHLLALEPEKFRQEIVTRPSQFDSWRKQEAKEWRAAQVLAGKTVLDPEEYKAVVHIGEALRAHPIHRDGILDGPRELSLIKRDPRTGVWLKGRPDAVPVSAPTLVDIKIMHDVRPRSVMYAIRDYGYDMQLALSGWLIGQLTGHPIEDHVLLPVEVDPPHSISIRPIDSQRIYWSLIWLRAAIDTFATCLRMKQWPALEKFDGEHVTISDDEHEELKKKQRGGELPKEW